MGRSHGNGGTSKEELGELLTWSTEGGPAVVGEGRVGVWRPWRTVQVSTEVGGGWMGSAAPGWLWGDRGIQGHWGSDRTWVALPELLRGAEFGKDPEDAV